MARVEDRSNLPQRWHRNRTALLLDERSLIAAGCVMFGSLVERYLGLRGGESECESGIASLTMYRSKSAHGSSRFNSSGNASNATHQTQDEAFLAVTYSP